jgi:hypothetical protein
MNMEGTFVYAITLVVLIIVAKFTDLDLTLLVALCALYRACCADARRGS